MKERWNARLETARYAFGRAREPRFDFYFISDVGIRGIYLSLALGTAKFKQLE